MLQVKLLQKGSFFKEKFSSFDVLALNIFLRNGGRRSEIFLSINVGTGTNNKLKGSLHTDNNRKMRV